MNNVYKSFFWWVLASHIGASLEVRRLRRHISIFELRYEALGKTTLYLAKLLEENGIEFSEFDLIVIEDFAREARSKER